MSRAAPVVAAWYPDPDDPLRMRHWNGRSWDLRRRSAPAWALGTSEYVPRVEGRREGDPVLDGPVHPAVLPATAAAASQGGRPHSRLALPGRFTNARQPAGATPPGFGAPGSSRPARSVALPTPRVALLLIAALIGLGVFVLAASVGVSPARTAATSLEGDGAFVRAANLACGETMGAARLGAPAISAGGSPTQPSVAAVAGANGVLDALASRLSNLPVQAANRPLVVGWLGDWSRFATDRRLVAAGGSGTGATGTRADMGRQAADADRFAIDNGLLNCTLVSGTSPLTHA